MAEQKNWNIRLLGRRECSCQRRGGGSSSGTGAAGQGLAINGAVDKGAVVRAAPELKVWRHAGRVGCSSHAANNKQAVLAAVKHGADMGKMAVKSQIELCRRRYAQRLRWARGGVAAEGSQRRQMRSENPAVVTEKKQVRGARRF